MSYNAEPIRGDRFVDRFVGWTVTILCLFVYVVTLYKTFHGAGNSPLEQGRYVVFQTAIILLSVWMTGSSPPAFRAYRILFAIRIAFDLYDLIQNPRDRFASPSLAFDAGMIWYASVRLRKRSVEERRG